MKRKIWFWLSFVLAIILAIYFATRTAIHLLGRGPAANVSRISIVADTNDADLGAIAAGAGVLPGTRMHDINLELIQARISAIPGVRRAAVRRLPGGALKVRVEMYRAVALWSDGEFYYPLSADGTIVKSPVAERTPGAVVFAGDVPDDISDIAAAAQPLANEAAYLTWIEGRRWDLYTVRGVRIMLPEEDATGAIATLVTLNRNHGILGRGIKQIDMRDMARILVK